jgi:signal transduction histidine kinase
MGRGDWRMSLANMNSENNESSVELYLKTLSELSLSSQNCEGIRDIAEHLIKVVSQTCDSEYIFIFKAQSKSDVLYICASSINNHSNLQQQQSLIVDPASIRNILKEEVTLLHEHEKLANTLFSQLSGGDKLKCGVIVPIPGYDSSWNAIAVFYESSNIINEHTITFLQAAANVVAASIQNNNFDNKQEFDENKINIINAKQDWEASIDSLPYIVIVLNQQAKVNRANKTIEYWGLSDVSSAKGLDIEELLKPLGFPNRTNQKYNWKSIWSNLNSNMSVSWESQNKNNGHALQYSLRAINSNQQFSSDYNQCYAVLTIEDISGYKATENALKEYTHDLEILVGKRTRELEIINKILQQDVQAQKLEKAELIESERKLRILSRQLINAQEIEQKRIAQDLHDSIGQSLGAIKFKIEDVLLLNINLDQKTDEQLNATIQMLKDLIEDVRRISMDLRPSMLDDLGIVSTLKWFSREYEHIYTDIKIKQQIDVDESDIPDAIKVVIYRLTQEAMNNIAKHANASRVDLILKKINNGLYLNISDNGCGFNHQNYTLSETSMRGLGLMSMQERAKSTSGSFSIQSSEQGTAIIVEWNSLCK